MNQVVKRSQRDYTRAFKQSVVDQVERGDLSYKEAQRRYGIQGRSTVLVWLRKYGRQDWSSTRAIHHPRNPDVADIPLTPEQRIKALEAELRQAAKQLKESEQKAEFFKAVVDVLEKDYGVSLVKKRSGASSRRRS